MCDFSATSYEIYKTSVTFHKQEVKLVEVMGNKTLGDFVL